MKLKTYLEKLVNDSLKKNRELVVQQEEILKILQKINTGKANYVICLDSLWENEGEESTITNYNGSLEKAIRKAEEEFKNKNKRIDTQARYAVYIKLGNLQYSVPEKFWEEYKEKH